MPKFFGKNHNPAESYPQPEGRRTILELMVQLLRAEH
jgi:hypothetical protein